MRINVHSGRFGGRKIRKTLFLNSKIKKNKNTNLKMVVREGKIGGLRRQKVRDYFYLQTELIEL